MGIVQDNKSNLKDFQVRNPPTLCSKKVLADSNNMNNKNKQVLFTYLPLSSLFNELILIKWHDFYIMLQATSRNMYYL